MVLLTLLCVTYLTRMYFRGGGKSKGSKGTANEIVETGERWGSSCLLNPAATWSHSAFELCCVCLLWHTLCLGSILEWRVHINENCLDYSSWIQTPAEISWEELSLSLFCHLNLKDMVVILHGCYCRLIVFHLEGLSGSFFSFHNSTL